MVDFGIKLKHLRTVKGLSQGQLAKKLYITKSSISMYESSARLPSYDILTKIALFFSVSTDYFLGLKQHNSLDITGLSERQVGILSNLLDEFKGLKMEEDEAE